MNESEATKTTFEGWAVVELFGHNQIAGYVTDAPQFGTSMMRVDVPKWATIRAIPNSLVVALFMPLPRRQKKLRGSRPNVWTCDQLANGLFRIRCGFRQATKTMTIKTMKTKRISMKTNFLERYSYV